MAILVVDRRENPGTIPDFLTPDRVFARTVLAHRTKGKERLMIHMLQGVNELHHTLANWLTAYASHETKAFPVDVLNPQHWKSQNIAVTV